VESQWNHEKACPEEEQDACFPGVVIICCATEKKKKLFSLKEYHRISRLCLKK
jgi:hypothetical protein